MDTRGLMHSYTRMVAVILGGGDDHSFRGFAFVMSPTHPKFITNACLAYADTQPRVPYRHIGCTFPRCSVYMRHVSLLRSRTTVRKYSTI